MITRAEFITAAWQDAACDVLVAGAGPAGLIAAIAAAKEGASVTLVERHGFVGGMLTAGEVRNIRVFNDGAGRWVVGDTPLEYLSELEAHGGAFNNARHCECVQQDPEVTKYIGEQMCLRYGVRLQYHSWICGVGMEKGAVCGVYALGKDGVRFIPAKVVIDATGDGDVAAFAGAAFDKDEALQPMTTTFLLGGVTSDRWPVVLSDASTARFKALVAEGKYPVPRDDLAAFRTARQGEVYCNITRFSGDCTRTEDLTAAEIACREQIANCVAFLRRELPEFKDAYLIHSAPQVGLRESRRIRGLYTLTEEDVVTNRDFDDTVAYNSYFIDIHHQDAHTTHYKRELGTRNGIPYRCLVPETVNGLLMAGRCISATHVAHGAIRVMGTAMGIGQAAGCAAAMAAGQGIQPRRLEIRALRERLRAGGVPL